MAKRRSRKNIEILGEIVAEGTLGENPTNNRVSRMTLNQRAEAVRGALVNLLTAKFICKALVSDPQAIASTEMAASDEAVSLTAGERSEYQS